MYVKKFAQKVKNCKQNSIIKLDKNYGTFKISFNLIHLV